jgi:hypothetical protein
MAFAAMAASALVCEPANAWTVDVKPDNNSLGLGRPLVEVESDGEEWTNIRSATRQLQLRVNVDVGTGWRVMDVWMNVPNADFCQSHETPEGCDHVFGGKTKHFSDVITHEFSTAHIGGIEAQALVDKCNEANYQGDRNRDFEGFNISVGIKAYVLKRSDANDLQEPDAGRTTTAYTQAPIVLRCLAPPQKIEVLKPVSVDIRVEQKGETCPKDAEVTAYIDYDKPMTGRFRVVHNGKQGEIIEIKAREMSFAGKTFYRIERLERYKLDPGKHNFKIKVIGGGKSDTKSIDVECPPFKVTSTWLTYEVEDKDTCKKQVIEKVRIVANRPGDVPFRVETAGGLVVNQGIAYTARGGDSYVAQRTRKLSMGAFDQMMRLLIVNDPSVGVTQTQLKVECLYKPTDAGASTDLAPETRPEDPPPVHPAVTGDFSFVDNGGTRCPRQGKALLNFELGQQSNVHYSLDCTNGHFSGVAQPVASPQGGYIAPALVSFDVDQTTHAKCALKTVAPGKPKVHSLKGHIFQCVTSTGVSGSDELAPDPRPDPQQPDKPGLTVADPQISCAGGSVKDGACVCERTMKPVKAGKNAWRCVQSVVDPKPDKATVSGPKIGCAGGTVKNGACTCARTHKPVKAGKDAWRCVKIVVADPPKDKGNANKVGVKTAPKNTATQKLGNTDKAKGAKGKGKTAKTGNGSSALR